MYDDGGRAAAGYKGTTHDCVVRAVSVATEQPYRVVFEAFNELAKTEHPRTRPRSSVSTGIYIPTTRRYLRALGWRCTPTWRRGQGVHLWPDELPAGRLIVAVAKHLVAVVDGVIRDTSPVAMGRRVCWYYSAAGRATEAGNGAQGALFADDEVQA